MNIYHQFLGKNKQTNNIFFVPFRAKIVIKCISTEKLNTINQQKPNLSRLAIPINSDFKRQLNSNSVCFYKNAKPIFSISKRYKVDLWKHFHIFFTELNFVKITL